MISVLLFIPWVLIGLPALLWMLVVRGVTRLLVPASQRQQWKGWWAQFYVFILRSKLKHDHALSDKDIHCLEGLIRPNTEMPLPPNVREQVKDLLSEVFCKGVRETADQIRPCFSPNPDAGTGPTE